MNFKFNNLSLRARLMMVMVGTSLLLLTLSAIILFLVEISQFRENRLSQAHTVIKAYSAQLADMTQFNTTELSVGMTSQLQAFPEILSFLVYDAQDQSVFSFISKDQIATDNLFNLQSLIVEQAITYQGRGYGRVNMEVSVQGYETYLLPYLGVAVTLIIILVILVLLMERWQEKHITRPISDLVGIFESSELGENFSLKINDRLPSEIRTLYESFNKLIKTVTETYNTLVEEKMALDKHAIVSATDVKGNIIYANDKFVAISGYSREELLGQNHRIIRSDEHPEGLYRQMWKTIANGRTWHGEIKNRSRNGGFYWVQATIVPFLNEEGKPYKYVSIRTDITERKQLEDELISTRQQAEHANQAKSEFLSSMSHELRTPLNAILGFSDLMLMDDELNKETLEFAGDIHKSGKHLLALIDEVLDLARIESGKLQLSLEAISLQEVLKGCHTLAVVLAEKNNIRLNFVAGSDYTVLADTTRLKQVILNLLSNAIKYNCEKGMVTLKYQVVEDNQLRISVTDTGQGISEEQQKKLFQPFERLGAEFSNIEGTGIGLSITRRLVEHMGGSIGVDSELGMGTTFWIKLNLSSVQTANEIREEMLQKTGNQVIEIGKPSKKLLYIEDNPANVRLIESVVSLKTPYKLLVADEPALGLAMANAQLPDLILLDINLPGMSGYEVLKQIRSHAQTRKIPVIAVSANAMPQDIEKGLAAGFSDYVTKPISVNQVLKAINKTIDLS